MRAGFEQQLTLGCTPIHEVKILTKTKSHMAALMEVIQYIYRSPKWNREIYSLFHRKLQRGKKKTGRTGMSLWEIFVLSHVRLCMNISYDELHFMANDSEMLRGILGVLPTDYSKGKQYEYQNIYDNIKLLDDQLLDQVNDIIVQVGHEVFNKKEKTALRTKIDSFVVETDTHFPTDYNLLWDSARSCIRIAKQICKKKEVPGWRKAKYWKRQLKGFMREIGKINSGGGANKEERLKGACRAYLLKARDLSKKTSNILRTMVFKDISELMALIELEYYHEMLDKHIDLVDRRILKGEKIPHEEKVFSIFQPFTEFIKKGKMHPNVEIGKKLFITTDQYNLIVDYQIGNHQADNQVTIPIADRLLRKYVNIQSLSVDKGFSDKKDKELLEAFIPEVIMPKKGKKNQKEKEIESSPKFKKLKNAHSAIESNINELEHRGLNRCPDRTWRNFNRYIGLAVSAYNLHKIGRKLLADRRKLEEEEQISIQQAA